MKNTKIIFAIIAIVFITGIAAVVVLSKKGSTSTQDSNINVVMPEDKKPPVAQDATASGEDCIITIEEKQYNVAELRNTHPGGDIFVCGTDMTETFYSEHDENLLSREMGRYLVE